MLIVSERAVLGSHLKKMRPGPETEVEPNTSSAIEWPLSTRSLRLGTDLRLGGNERSRYQLGWGVFVHKHSWQCFARNSSISKTVSITFALERCDLCSRLISVFQREACC